MMTPKYPQVCFPMPHTNYRSILGLVAMTHAKLNGVSPFETHMFIEDIRASEGFDGAVAVCRRWFDMTAPKEVVR